MELKVAGTIWIWACHLGPLVRLVRLSPSAPYPHLATRTRTSVKLLAWTSRDSFRTQLTHYLTRLGIMLSPQTLSAYRSMTPAERLRLTLDMIAENEKFLLFGDEQQVRRKFELLNRQNDERNAALLQALRLAQQRQRNPKSTDSDADE
ncbi:MAG: hypothetical protein AAF958_16975 [Planctomycetota bacterium]